MNGSGEWILALYSN